MMRRKKGQSAMEYLVLVTIIMAALISGGVYFKRGLQGRWKSATDDLGDQYDMMNMNTDIVHSLRSDTETRITTQATGTGVVTMRDDQTNSVEAKGGHTSTGAF